MIEIKSGEYNSTLSHVVPDIKELKKSMNQVQTDIKSIQDAPARDAQLSTDNIKPKLDDADKEKLLQEVTLSVKASLAIHDVSGMSLPANDNLVEEVKAAVASTITCSGCVELERKMQLVTQSVTWLL